MATLQQLCIVAGINTAGEPVILYSHFDSAAAEAAYRNAGPDFNDVAIFGKGTPARNSRKPAREEIDTKARLKAQEDSTVSAKKAKLAEADKHEEQAIKHSHAAQAIRDSITPEAAAIQETFLKSASIISPEATLAPKKSKK